MMYFEPRREQVADSAETDIDPRKKATRDCSVYRKHLTLRVNNELPFHYLT
jgi:hypothetical protein